MRKFLLFFVVLSMAAFSLFGQTPIADIQNTGGAPGDSPLKGQEVTIQAVVSSEPSGSNYANGGINGSYYFVQDANAAWSGIEIYSKDSTAAYGDLLEITGTVDEYRGMTEITNVTSFKRISTRNPIPGPVVVTVAEANSEAYEGCLVQLQNVTVIEINTTSYANWTVSDGTDTITVDTRAKYYFTPEVGQVLKSLTGVILSYNDTYSIAPSLAIDIVESGEFTRIQAIQQVRNSDLVLAFKDSYSDSSYFRGDTVKIQGVVTMPTGLSYAGAGIKFILGEPEGGPWSAILSYHPDSTAYPTLLEGDVVEMSGYIDEYRTAPSNMTEFWITSPIDIVDIGHELPAVDTVDTGDLRLPVDAEQWGNVMVAVKDAKVSNVNLQYELFALNDGSGAVAVDDDSDSLAQYYSNNPKPPLGTIAESIKGWIYHHYGSYVDTSIYKLEPLYMTDIIWGAGPPVINSVERSVAYAAPNQAVTLTVSVSTNLTVAEVAAYYSTGAEYTKVVLASTDGKIFTGEIPGQSAGSVVNYYVTATDEIAQMSMVPADISILNLSYLVKEGPVTIHDVQYTSWEMADSPFEGEQVEITGVVTTNSAINSLYKTYTIQDTEGAWGGVMVFGLAEELNPGDEVKVVGTVTDYNADYHYKWDNNTSILAESVEILSSGNTVAPVVVTSGALNDDSAEAEMYESVFVKIQNLTLDYIDKYDVSFTDGSGSCRVDGDFLVSGDQYENDKIYINQDGGYIVAWGDTLRPGDMVSQIQGIFTYSFGTYKIELRGAEDFGVPTGVNPDFKAQPLAFELKQNFPNPFNPETRIYYTLPENQDVKLIIYNVLGQQVRTLVSSAMNAGHHVVNWDGRNEAGQLVPSGLYFYRIKAGNNIASRRMMLLK